MSILGYYGLLLVFIALSSIGFLSQKSKREPKNLKKTHAFLAHEKISIKHIRLKDLLAIEGLSRKKALDIFDHLQGEPNKGLMDLLNVKGIGMKTIEKLSSYLSP